MQGFKHCSVLGVWQVSRGHGDSGVRARVSEFESKAGATDRFLRLNLKINGHGEASKSLEDGNRARVLKLLAN